jgi:hypothetical protein
MIRPAYRPPGSPPTLAEYKAIMADRDRPLTDYPMGRRRNINADHGTEDAYTGITVGGAA